MGAVQDASGAAVANAAVDATNEATNLKASTKTNGNGEYRFTNLPAGSYTLTANGAGFSPASLRAVAVTVGRVATVNLTLQIGQVATTVDVTEAPAAIDTTTATIGGTFDARDSRDLPVSSIGPGVLNLALLSAGVGSNGGLAAGDGPSVGGQRPRNNNFTVEGVDNNNKSVTGPLLTIPNDATAEFTVMQNQFSSEFGHSSGGQFNVTIKSGTNSLHGMLYEYFQNRNLNALDQLFANSGTLSNPRFDFNRIGGNIGGPILKNKLFYFVDFEYSPTGEASSPGAILAPTQQGYSTLSSLSGLSATNLAQFKKYVAPAATPLQDTSQYPIVNGAPIQVGFLNVVAPNYINTWAGVVSLDYNISDKDQLRGRYAYNRQIFLDTSAQLPVFYQVIPQLFHLATISEYHNFSPSLVNELRLGYNRFSNDTPAGNYQFPGLDAFPNLSFSDLNGLLLGPDEFAPQSQIQNTYQLNDNVTWTRGRHTLQFGFDGRRSIAPSVFVQRERGDYEYSTLDLYLHDITPDLVAQRTLGNPTYYGNDWRLYGYVSDAWRYRPNFTINLGLRYEYTTPPLSAQTQSLNSISNVPGVLTFNNPQAQKTNFAPRVGVVWSPGKSGNTSIRAGFGMAYDVIYDNIGILAVPPQFATTIDVSGAGTPNFLANGGITQSAKGGALTPAEARAATSSYVPDQKLPYSIQWNLGIQHVFAKDFTFEGRYLGTRGVHLDVQQRLNKLAPVTATNSLPTYLQMPSQATLDALPLTLTQLRSMSNIVPHFGNAGFTNSAFVEDSPIGNSSYNGLALQLNKRYSNGLQFIGSYTWSHTIDDSTADFASTLLTPRRPEDFQNMRVERASSALDRRQRFTFAAVYDVPFFRKSNWFLKNMVGNWSVAPIYTYETPEWVTVLSQQDSNLNGDSAADRTIINPNGITGTGSSVVPLTNSAGQTVAYLATNPQAQYIRAGVGAYANGGRNTLPGRPINNVDLNLLKNFDIRERAKIQFSAQFFNFFNHPQFVPGFLNRIDNPSVPNTSGAVFNYLTPGNAIFNNPEAIYSSNPRGIQLALKVLF
ncbi:MAG TPA: carboxypeptidase regulatory-like domain-containing protein [Bryobacteraceae bacterium]|nr:carboxypeptidase regulatory-like domain-containing protein [Bryobacteraceae bacterium]